MFALLLGYLSYCNVMHVTYFKALKVLQWIILKSTIELKCNCEFTWKCYLPLSLS